MKTRKRIVVGLVAMVVCLFLLILTLVAFGQDPKIMGRTPEWRETDISRFVNLPDSEKLKIIPPDQDLPAGIAALSGRWEGVWDFDLKSILFVRKINGDTAKILYATGPLPHSNRNRGQWNAYEAKISSGRISFSTLSGNIEFVLKGSTLCGTYEHRGSRRVYSIVMERVE